MSSGIVGEGQRQALLRAGPAEWFEAIRPKTLIAGAVPIGVGSAVAASEGQWNPLAALGTLGCVMLLQVGTNLGNDYYDFVRGADTGERVGPRRVTQSGLIPPRTVLSASLGCFLAAILLSVLLARWGGWPIVAVCVVSAVAGYLYTGGPYPYGYYGLGDLFVFVFFGLVWVGWGYFAQAGRMSALVAICSIPVGALGTALLVINNLRDAATDAKADKRTLVVRFGVRPARAEYCAVLAATFLVPSGLWVAGLGNAWLLLPLLSLPAAVRPLRLVLAEPGPALNRALGATALLQLLFGVLFMFGLARGLYR